MDLGTIIGVVLAFILIVGSMLLGGSIMIFVNLPGILIVFGGTVAATLTAQRMSIVIGSMGIAMKAFKDSSPNIPETIKTILELSTTVRKSDLLALESVTISDPFLTKGVRMAVDGVPLETIRSTLSAEMQSLAIRHQVGQKTFRFMAATAPSMGMVGTLIGLVQMLQALDDPSSIGPAMAVALLTTLYGAVLAFVVFGPIADKLEVRTDLEVANMQVIIQGIGSIVEGENASIVQEKLDAYVAPTERASSGEAA